MALSLWTFGRHTAGGARSGMLIFLSCMSQLLLVQGLNLFTCLLIASGIGLRTAGWFESRLRRSRRLIPPGIVALLVIVIGLAGGSLSWDRSARTRAERGRNAAASPVRNVLLIVLDTVRADHLGLYGYARPTAPNLSRLANEGVRFERARSTAPWTLPIACKHVHWALAARAPRRTGRLARRHLPHAGRVLECAGLLDGRVHREPVLLRP